MGISKDSSLAWSIVQVKVAGRRKMEDGVIDNDCQKLFLRFVSKIEKVQDSLVVGRFHKVH